jgi:hypothetical protein
VPVIPELRALKSRTCLYKGKSIVLFHIKAVADYVGMSHEGLKKWRRMGVLPDALFWLTTDTNLVRSNYDGRIVRSGKMLFYTVEEMLTLKYLLSKFGKRRTMRVEFMKELHIRFANIRERIENGESAADLAPMQIEVSSLREFAETLNRAFFENQPRDIDHCLAAANLLISRQAAVTH